jgi:hypothetical protein
MKSKIIYLLLCLSLLFSCNDEKKIGDTHCYIFRQITTIYEVNDKNEAIKVISLTHQDIQTECGITEKHAREIEKEMSYDLVYTKNGRKYHEFRRHQLLRK